MSYLFPGRNSPEERCSLEVLEQRETRVNPASQKETGLWDLVCAKAKLRSGSPERNSAGDLVLEKTCGYAESLMINVLAALLYM